MYISRVMLNTSRRNTQIALNSPNRFHGAIEDSFNEKQDRNLWRIDRLNGNSYMIMVSCSKPDLDSFIEQFSDKGQKAEIISYDKFLESIQNGSIWRFRLVANPTRSIKQDGEERGKVVAHIKEKYQLEWLLQKASKNGFHIVQNGTESSASVTASEWKNFKKKNKYSVHLLAVSYDGILRVDDAELFRHALCNGIGREKAYGMGLLTIMRV